MKKLTIVFAAFLMLGSMYLVQVKSAVNDMPTSQTFFACKNSITKNSVVIDSQASRNLTYTIMDQQTGDLVGTFSVIANNPVVKKYTITANQSGRYGLILSDGNGELFRSDFYAKYSCDKFSAYFPAPAKQ